MPKIETAEKTRRIIEELESLPFLHMYSIGSRVDLLLVWSGEKLATDIHLGYVWETKAKPQHLSSKELERSKIILKEAGLFFTEGPLATEAIQGTEDNEEMPTVKYTYEKKDVFVARDSKNAAILQEASRTENEKILGKLFGFPPTAVRAYIEAKDNPQTIIDISELPQDIQDKEYMAFAQFKLSQLHWREELETARRWAQKIKDLDPKLYQETVRTYKNVTK